MDYIDISKVKLNEELPKIDFNVDDGCYELACSIFDYCNLNCNFCFQKHSKDGFDYNSIMQIPDKMYNRMKSEFELYNIKEIELKLWGGELFFDAIPDKFFNAYRYLYDRFTYLVLKDFPNMKIYPVWLSNGIFTKYNRVENLLKYTNGKLALSYDPKGRFTSTKMIEIWLHTFWHFYDLVKGGSPTNRLTLSITPTKNNIHSYLSDLIANMLFILPKVQIDISYYTADNNYLANTPNDDDMFIFYKFLLDNRIFNCQVTEAIMKTVNPYETHHAMYCNCKKAMQFSNKECIKNCALRASRNLPQELFYGKYYSEVTEDNCTEYKNSLGIIKRGCLICEWYNTCQKTCWISILNPEYKIKECPLKRIYKYIDDDIFKDYLNWKEREYHASKK